MVRPSVRQLALFVCLQILCLSESAVAQQFPYQAVVVKDQAEVRCGPGANLYVTSFARLNEEIVVHRHDHGGWYMVSPPSDSFSLIEKRLVDRSGGQLGIVNLSPGSGNVPRAIAYIGSVVTEDASRYGRELNHGDQVTILGEQVVRTKNGPLEMYKIQPPQQEFRWIKGEAVVPRNQAVQQQMAADPYQVPPQQRQRLAADGRGLLVAAVTDEQPIRQVAHQEDAQDSRPMRVDTVQFQTPEYRTASAQTELVAPSMSSGSSSNSQFQAHPNSGSQSVSTAKPAVRSPNPDYVRLHEIDRELEAMVKRDPKHWDFTKIVQDYRNLSDRAAPNVKLLVKERLENAENRKKIADHYQKFIQISAETAARDQGLVGQQSSMQASYGQSGQYGQFTGDGQVTDAEMYSQFSADSMVQSHDPRFSASAQQSAAQDGQIVSAYGETHGEMQIYDAAGNLQSMTGTTGSFGPVGNQSSNAYGGQQGTGFNASSFSQRQQGGQQSYNSMNQSVVQPSAAPQLQPTLGMQGPMLPLMAPGQFSGINQQSGEPSVAGSQMDPTHNMTSVPGTPFNPNSVVSDNSQIQQTIQQTAFSAGAAQGAMAVGNIGGAQGTPATGAPSGSKYSGAGVLHEMQGPPEFPKFCLVAKDGRLLAFITPPPGLNMDEFLGREVGVVGARQKEVALGGDHIRATQFEFVQLNR